MLKLKSYFIIFLSITIISCKNGKENTTKPNVSIENDHIKFNLNSALELKNKTESEISNSYMLQKLDFVNGEVVIIQVTSFKSKDFFREDMIDHMIESTDMSHDMFFNMLKDVTHQDTKAKEVLINNFKACELTAIGKDKNYGVLDIYLEISWIEACDGYVCIKYLGEKKDLTYANTIKNSLACINNSSSIQLN